MRRNAVGIMLAGFVFALFAVQVGGIDLLLDAVGWLLVFNGLRPMERPGGGVGPRAALCLALVAVSAAQLFLTAGTPELVAYVARMALEAAFFLLMMLFFYRMLAGFSHRKTGIALGCAFALNALVSLAQLGAALARNFVGLPGPEASAVGVIGGADGPTAIFVASHWAWGPVVALVAHVLLLAALLWVLVIFHKEER